MFVRSIKLLVVAALVGSVAALYAQTFNSWQVFKPFRSNYMARLSGVELPQQESIVFQHDLFDGASTPQVGSVTYARTGALRGWSSSTTLTEYSSNQLPLAVRYNGTETLKGFLAHGGIRNYLLYSDDFTNAAWSAVGTGQGTAADTIIGSSGGDGLQQDSNSLASSNKFVFSVFLRVSSGTATVRIVVKDEGTQWGFVDCPVTTTERRFQVPHEFLSGTGDAFVQIIVGNTSTVRARGAQLEQISSGDGRRIAHAGASPSVKTTGSATTTATGTYFIPNAIAAQAATKGSIAFWYLTELDWSDKVNGSANYVFSLGLDLLSMSFAYDTLYFYVNNSVAATTGSGLTQSAMVGPQPDRWTHFVATWDTDTDIYKVYINGTEAASGTGAIAAPNFGTNDLNFGAYVNGASPYGYYASEGTISQIVMWDTPLTSDEANSAYLVKRSSAERSDPGTGLIFSVDLGSSPLPTVGDTEYYWGRTLNGPYYYYDSTTSAKATALGAHPAPAYALNGQNVGGWFFSSKMTNLILQSEAPATTWTQVGTPTSVANTGSTLGEIVLGTISNDAANEGIQQSVATTVASKGFTASVFVKSSAGTVNGSLIIEGDSGGTPETTTATFAATTTTQRIHVYKSFSGAATGNIRMKIIITDAGPATLYVGGMMLERTETTGGSYQSKGSPYIRTTTASASSGHTQIHYRASDSFNPDKGTAIAWAFLSGGLNASGLTGNGPTIIGAPGQFANFYWHYGNGTSNIFDYGGLSPATAGNSDFSEWQWYHLAITWDKATHAWVVYKNGVAVSTGSTDSTYNLTNRKMIVGGDFLFKEMDYWQGAIKTIKIYGEAKNLTFIDDDFDATKASYGY